MYLFGIKCPICQAEKDMPVDEFSFDTREEKTCGIAYAKCMQCDSRFEIVIPVTLGPEFTMRRLDQNPQAQSQTELSEAPPTCEYP